MKRPLFLVVLALTMASCAAPRARQYTLEPALGLAWPAIEVQALRGGLELEDAEAFGAALSGRDFTVILSLWPRVMIAAVLDTETRLAEGVIGPGVARSLRERLDQFTEGVALITGRLNE